jgi:hypothetical protein
VLRHFPRPLNKQRTRKRRRFVERLVDFGSASIALRARHYYRFISDTYQKVA